MIPLIYCQLGLTLAGTILTAMFASPAAGLSFAVGALVTLFNLAILVFGWPRLLAQKQVALAGFAVIFKFAILGWILYLVTHSPSIQIGWFAFGLATIFPNLLFGAFFLRSTPDVQFESDHGANS